MKKYVAYYNRKTRKLGKKFTYIWWFRWTPSLLTVQKWQELFSRKELTVIIFRNFMKLSRWERKMKLWENCNANGKITKNKCVSYWTRDISSWSLEEKLHRYNITHSVNSSLSIQLWQSVTCPALRRKVILRIASVFH